VLDGVEAGPAASVLAGVEVREANLGLFADTLDALCAVLRSWPSTAAYCFFRSIKRDFSNDPIENCPAETTGLNPASSAGAVPIDKEMKGACTDWTSYGGNNRPNCSVVNSFA
jgi:hypothetical protein